MDFHSSSHRDLDAKNTGGFKGREQKKNLSHPGLLIYLGSLNGFQIKAKGLSWTHSSRGCFPGNLLASPTSPTGGKASPRGRAWQPPQQPQRVALFTFPAQANPGSPPWGTRAPCTCKDHPLREGRTESGCSKHCRIWMTANHWTHPHLMWDLASKWAAVPGAPPAYFQSPSLKAIKSKASLCQR